MNETISINTEDFFITALKDLQISENRHVLLESIANAIVKVLRQKQPVCLHYISTYNSRSSQISQVWSSYASNYYQLNHIENFSGGTEVTAFHRNTVKTLQKVGFTFKILEFSHQNPKYSITYHHYKKPIIVFSKLYNHELPIFPFIAITTNANEREDSLCIPEAIQNFEMPFKNLKSLDNSIYKTEKYLAVNKQIAGEIHFIFQRITTAL